LSLFQSFPEIPALHLALTQQEYNEKRQHDREEEIKRLASVEANTSQEKTEPASTESPPRAITPASTEPSRPTEKKPKVPHPNILQQLDPIKKELTDIANTRIQELESRIEQLEQQLVGSKAPATNNKR